MYKAHFHLSPEIANKCATTLQRFGINPKNIEEIVDCGAIEKICSSIQVHTGAVLGSHVAALCVLVDRPEHIQLMEKCHGVEAALSCTGDALQSAAHTLSLVKLLTSLGQHGYSVDRLVDKGSIDVVLSALQLFDDDAGVLEASQSLLTLLANNPKGANKIFSQVSLL
jgi:hypothetical protein